MFRIRTHPSPPSAKAPLFRLSQFVPGWKSGVFFGQRSEEPVHFRNHPGIIRDNRIRPHGYQIALTMYCPIVAIQAVMAVHTACTRTDTFRDELLPEFMDHLHKGINTSDVVSGVDKMHIRRHRFFKDVRGQTPKRYDPD